MLALLVLSCARPVPPATAGAASAPADPPVAAAAPAGVPAELYAAAAASTVAYQRLQHLSDHIGQRMVGSQALRDAEQWAAETLRADGFRVSLEPVEVPVWVRGEEQARLLAPVARDLPLLGLGHTLATPAEGLEGEVLAVGHLDELRALPEGAALGRIVLLDQPFTTYGETVQARVHGPQVAAEKGAVAILVRSVTNQSLGAPHTGMTSTAADIPRVPAAALTVEDAAWLHRLADDGVTARVRLSLGGHMAEPTTHHNVLAELPGRELADQIVVVGCHLDSWDVGQGAQDDGVGCAIAWEALRLISLRPEPPRRTLRLVLYTAEEIGAQGGEAYAAAHADEHHVALLESDTGNGRADGLRVDLHEPSSERDAAVSALEAELAAVLKAHGGGDLRRAYSGADIRPTVAQGPIGFGLAHDTATYWPIHHTSADTFDKVVLADLQHNAGLMAAAAWWLAERPGDEAAFDLGAQP